jgi:hypothetical protein
MEDHIDLEELASLPLKDQAASCLSLLGRGEDLRHYATGFRDAEEAAVRLGDRTMEEYLAQIGISVVDTRDGAYGNVRLRAVLDLSHKRIMIYADALAEVERALAFFSVHLEAPARQVVLAHEVFHCLMPDCPAERADLSAHLFATLILRLRFYAGIIDVACVSYRRKCRDAERAVAGGHSDVECACGALCDVERDVRRAS